MAVAGVVAAAVAVEVAVALTVAVVVVVVAVEVAVVFVVAVVLWHLQSSLPCATMTFKATSKPNASTICELEKIVHKMCIGGWI